MKVLSFVVAGRDNFDIKCSMFDKAIERFDHVIEEGVVYSFSGGKIRFDNYPRKSEQFTASRYTITFNEMSDIQPAVDDGSIKKLEATAITLDKVRDYLNKIVSIRCVVNELKSKVYEPNFTSKKGQSFKRRVLCVCDPRSGAETELTLWNEVAEKYAVIGRCVIEASGVKVSEFMGNTTIGTTSGSRISILYNDPLCDYLSGVEEGFFYKVAGDDRKKDTGPVYQSTSEVSDKLENLPDGQ